MEVNGNEWSRIEKTMGGEGVVGGSGCAPEAPVMPSAATTYDDSNVLRRITGLY
jgi:hypothetical protein